MEPTVRDPRIKSAIGSEAGQSPPSGSRLPGAAGPRNPVGRNGIFGCRDQSQKIHPRDRYVGRDRGTLKIGGKIPAETASFRSRTVFAVREDWVVVCAVICEPVSGWQFPGIREFYREFCDSGALRQDLVAIKRCAAATSRAIPYAN